MAILSADLVCVNDFLEKMQKHARSKCSVVEYFRPYCVQASALFDFECFLTLGEIIYRNFQLLH
jgi:hypothetical protein